MSLSKISLRLLVKLNQLFAVVIWLYRNSIILLKFFKFLYFCFIKISNYIFSTFVIFNTIENGYQSRKFDQKLWSSKGC